MIWKPCRRWSHRGQAPERSGGSRRRGGDRSPRPRHPVRGFAPPARVRDYAQVRADGNVTKQLAMGALDLLQVDPLGLDDVDRRVLKTIIEKYGGGPVGLNSIPPPSVKSRIRSWMWSSRTSCSWGF